MARPTPATRMVAHGAVGVLAAYITWKAFRAGAAGAVGGALLGVLLHAMLDAPVARGMAARGIQF